MSNTDPDKFWELLEILTARNPDRDALTQAQQYVYDFDRIPFLIETLKQDDQNHVFLAKSVLRRIVKSPRDLFPKMDFCQFVHTLSDEVFEPFIQECFNMMKNSFEYASLFSKIIFKLLFARIPQNLSGYYANLWTTLTSFVQDVTEESPKDLITVTSKLYKRMLKSYTPNELREQTFISLADILSQSFLQSQNLYLTTLFVEAFIKTHMVAADYLFRDGQYGWTLIQLLSNPEAIMQISSNPYFFQFLETNCTFLLKFSDLLTSGIKTGLCDGLIENLVPPLVNLIPQFIAFIYQEFPDNPSNETLAQSLLSIINDFFEFLLQAGLFNEEENFKTILNLVFQFSHPSQNDIQEFRNLRNYYLSVFLDTSSLFQREVSIIEKICRTEHLPFIQCVLELLFSGPNEGSLFIISRIYPFFRDDLKPSEEKEQIITAIKVYVKNWFDVIDGLDQRMVYSVLNVIVSCADLLDPDDYPKLLEIIGNRLGNSIQTTPDGQVVPAISTPEICVDFTFASDLARSLVIDLNVPLPDDFIKIFMFCFINCYSNSALEILQYLIDEHPENFIEFQIGFLETCITVVETGFAEHQTADQPLNEFDADIFEYHLSFIQFISIYHSDQYPTEHLIETFKVCLSSEPFTSSEFVCYIPFIARNVIEALQPGCDLVLAFILEQFNIATFHCFENDFCQPIMQSLVSFPLEVLRNFVNPIYNVIKTNITTWIFQRVGSTIQESFEQGIQHFNRIQRKIMEDAVDYFATFGVMARLIQLIKDSLTPPFINDILQIIKQLYAFQFHENADGGVLPIKPCIELIFYEVFASLCLCPNFDFAIIPEFYDDWIALIENGYIKSLYLRRLHYAALSIIVQHPGFETCKERIYSLLGMLINNTYNVNEDSLHFFEEYDYFSNDRDIPSPLEKYARIPEFVVDEEEEED